jgi:CheY-like chemotaxis protein
VKPWVRPILLVEDNPMDVDLTLQAFAEHSVVNTVVVCRDGEEAVRYIDEHRQATDPGVPILVLLDLRMPKVDGIDVLKHARNDPVWKQVPIVVVTTSRENKDIEVAYQLGGQLLHRQAGGLSRVRRGGEDDQGVLAVDQRAAVPGRERGVIDDGTGPGAVRRRLRA